MNCFHSNVHLLQQDDFKGPKERTAQASIHKNQDASSSAPTDQGFNLPIGPLNLAASIGIQATWQA